MGEPICAEDPPAREKIFLQGRRSTREVEDPPVEERIHSRGRRPATGEDPLAHKGKSRPRGGSSRRRLNT